jgi:ferredoxin-NADP reductase
MRRETPRSSLGGGAEVGPRMVGPPSGFKLRVVSSRQLTPTSHAIELEKPNAFMFRPTQFTFLQLLLTAQGRDARPTSLETSPTRPHLEHAIRLSDSPYKRAFAALQAGDEVLVFGPIGHLCPSRNAARDIHCGRNRRRRTMKMAPCRKVTVD